jgi:predicted nuclease with TOPRIM domain
VSSRFYLGSCGSDAASYNGCCVREKLIARLNELQSELEAGERRMRAVEAEAARLRETMLRISGAIQVLQEVLEVSTETPHPQEGATNTSMTPAPLE